MSDDKSGLMAQLRNRLSRISFGSRPPRHGNSPLPDEVVHAICRHARVSVSGIAQKRKLTARDMAQPELAVLMRVSKQFYNIAGPMLYTHITTSDLTLLLHDILPTTSLFGLKRRPRLSPTKAWLLSHCRHLSLESLEMIKPFTARFDVVQDRLHRKKPYLKSQGAGHVYSDYIDGMIPDLKAINEYGGLAWLFPRLESLSVCAFGTVYDLESRYRFSNETAWGLLREADALIRSAAVDVRCYGTHTAWPFAWSAMYRIESRSFRGDEHVTQYVHTTKTDSYRIHNRSKTVYLYHDTSDIVANGDSHMSQKDLENLLDRLVKLVRSERTGREYHAGDNPVDIEIRIPRAFCPPWRDRGLDDDAEAEATLRSRLNALRRDRTMIQGDWIDPADKWKIVVTQGVQYCPACAQPYGLVEDDRSDDVQFCDDDLPEYS